MTSWSLRFSRPPVPSVLDARVLSVVFVALGHSSTGVLAEAADMWVLPRPASERIPAEAAVLEVAVTRPKEPPSPSIAVTNLATIAKITRFIDALETVQPRCDLLPGDSGRRLIRNVYLPRHAQRPSARKGERAGASERHCFGVRTDATHNPRTPPDATTRRRLRSAQD